MWAVVGVTCQQGSGPSCFRHGACLIPVDIPTAAIASSALSLSAYRVLTADGILCPQEACREQQSQSWVASSSVVGGREIE